MKIRINAEEFFPVYVVEDSEYFGLEVDVPEELIKELDATMKRFAEIQNRLREAYEKAYEAKHGRKWL